MPGFPPSRITVNLPRVGSKRYHEEIEGVTKATKKSATDAREIRNSCGMNQAGLINRIPRSRTKRSKDTKTSGTDNRCFVGLLFFVPGHHFSPQPPLPPDPFAFEKFWVFAFAQAS
jgi:hypothetical protein